MRAVATVFRVLEELTARQPIGVSELARVLDLPKSTVQRALVDLHQLGWIEPESDDGARRWVQSVKLLALATRAGGLGLREIALPVMRRLRDETDENVHLSVRTGDTITVIEKLESSRAVRPFDRIGAVAPVHASSTGKAILAWGDPAEVEALIERGLPRFTQHTLIDPDERRRELAAARRAGYAANREEWRDDVRGVAAPLFDGRGRLVAAISVAVPAHRLPDRLIPVLGDRVAAAARDVVVPDMQTLREAGSVSQS